MKRSYVFAVLAFFAFHFCLPAAAAAAERITLMDVTARVETDATLAVTERIDFVAEHVEIRRGLIRDIPVRFRNEHGRMVWSKFRFLGAKLDGAPVPYKLERNGGNMEIHLGDDRFLSKGKHSYEIAYTLSDILIFHEDGDELYWNVTGNDWIFPIDKACFRVELPQGARIFESDGAVGRMGSTRREWGRRSDGTFETLRPLGVREGFTVTVTWDKGHVVPPRKTIRERVLERYGKPLYAFFSLSVVLGYGIVWWFVGRDPRKGTIIPLFSPPDGLEPAYAGYVKRRRFEPDMLVADLLQLAVSGYLDIAPQSDGMTLQRTAKEVDARLPAGLRALMEWLFSGGRRQAQLGGGAGSGGAYIAGFTRKTVRNMKRFYATYGPERGNARRPVLWKRNLWACFVGLPLVIPMLWVLSYFDGEACFVLFMSFLAPLPYGAALFVFGRAWYGEVRGRLRKTKGAVRRVAGVMNMVFPLFFLVPILLAAAMFLLYMATLMGPFFAFFSWAALFAVYGFSLCMFSYTKTGREYLDQVEGLELYLKVAEKHRLEALYPALRGKIPEETVETFERCLPYALALDVADTWLDAYAAMLDRAEYHPSWYRGSGSFDSARLRASMGDMRDSMRRAPSSSGGGGSRSSGSGRGGGSSSGGGRGGGGGRGR